jgi:hypothetical protein
MLRQPALRNTTFVGQCFPFVGERTGNVKQEGREDDDYEVRTG